MKTDKEEGNISLTINAKIYSIEVINAAAYAFLEEAYIILDGDPKKEIIVKLYPKKSQELNELALKFNEQLINYKNYFTNMKINAEVTKNIVERALFSANPSLLDEAEEQEINDLLKELEKEDDEEIREIAKDLKNESNKAK